MNLRVDFGFQYEICSTKKDIFNSASFRGGRKELTKFSMYEFVHTLPEGKYIYFMQYR